MKTMPVMPSKCATCPFREESEGGWSELRELLTLRALEATPICHSTGGKIALTKGGPRKSHSCRGARDQQLELFHRIGFMSEPTDECWAAKWKEMQTR